MTIFQMITQDMMKMEYRMHSDELAELEYDEFLDENNVFTDSDV